MGIRQRDFSSEASSRGHCGVRKLAQWGGGMEEQEVHGLGGQKDLSGILGVALTSSTTLGQLFNLNVIFLTCIMWKYVSHRNALYISS